MEKATKPRVLVTGITGFLGSYVGKLLLEKESYLVRGTVRDKSNAKKLAPLKVLPHSESLELVEADLLKPETWDIAVKDCDYVMHVASPFPTTTPRNENDLIRPAVEGTMAVLKACAKHKVKHVVITSSIAAILSGGRSAKDEYDEKDWADLNTVPAYNKSKTLAERSAWDFYHSLDPSSRFRLTTINPGFIFGPSLINTDFSSGDVIRQLMTGELFALPKMHFGVVDVRDVALAHINSIEKEGTDGQRYICCAKDHLWIEDISKILRKEFAKYGYRITSRNISYCLFRVVAMCDRQAKTIVPFWNRAGIFHAEKAEKELGISFISAEEAVLKMAYSLIECGLVPNRINDGIKKSK